MTPRRIADRKRDTRQPRGLVMVVTVAHDADCPRPEGGPCTCTPDVTEHVHKPSNP